MKKYPDNTLYGWHLPLGLEEFKKVLLWQHGLVKMREQGLARDTIITVEHPSVITVGRDGHRENYADPDCRPVYVERGGDVTYHGPGQLVVYFIFNLARRERDIHRFMENIQDGIILTLAEYGIEARKDDEHTGVWVGERKISSVGIAVKKWISFHGAALNLNTSLDEFAAISPCGLDPAVMISAREIKGEEIDIEQCTRVLLERYAEVFGTEFSPVSLESLAEEIESQAGGYGV